MAVESSGPPTTSGSSSNIDEEEEEEEEIPAPMETEPAEEPPKPKLGTVVPGFSVLCPSPQKGALNPGSALNPGNRELNPGNRELFP